jgi:hypothetical protein
VRARSAVGPRVEVELYHLKYAGGEPGRRLEDLYVVCGQAQRSTSWLANHGRRTDLSTHPLGRNDQRVQRGAPTRFERGTEELLLQIRETSRRSEVKLKAHVVQPGLSFGNLFAAVDGVGYPLDRHPTTSRHPVTPKGESDLRCHLAAQTTCRTELIDMLQLRRGTAAQRAAALAADNVPIVLIDVLDEETLAAAGRLVWQQRGDGLFSASSSGLQYALTAHCRELGLLPKEPSLPERLAVRSIAVVSGG